jgi:hypothetical protein
MTFIYIQILNTNLLHSTDIYLYLKCNKNDFLSECSQGLKSKPIKYNKIHKAVIVNVRPGRWLVCGENTDILYLAVDSGT